MDTAWGRRVYDQYEMEVEIEKPRNSYLSGKSRKKKAGCLTKRTELRELGVWDVIFDRAIISDLQGKGQFSQEMHVFKSKGGPRIVRI